MDTRYWENNRRIEEWIQVLQRLGSSKEGSNLVAESVEWPDLHGG